MLLSSDFNLSALISSFPPSSPRPGRLSRENPPAPGPHPVPTRPPPLAPSPAYQRVQNPASQPHSALQPPFPIPGPIPDQASLSHTRSIRKIISSFRLVAVKTTTVVQACLNFATFLDRPPMAPELTLLEFTLGVGCLGAPLRRS